ncbi:MAG: hypothetical protein ABFD52_02450 [Acidobacteriota bacterium]
MKRSRSLALAALIPAAALAAFPAEPGQSGTTRPKALDPAAARKRGAGKEAAKRLYRAAEEMQEMQTSFNLQYLELQNRIARENRQFSLIQNILKDKHGTAKNAINNVR